MASVIRIDDLGAPVLNEMQRMGIEYGESTHTDLSVDAVCTAASARTGLEDFGPGDFRERLGLQLAEMDADGERTGLGRILMFSDCTRVCLEPSSHPRPLETAPRDPGHTDHATGDRGRAPPFRHDAPGEPAGL